MNSLVFPERVIMRFMHNCEWPHWNVEKDICKYLISTKSIYICFEPTNPCIQRNKLHTTPIIKVVSIVLLDFHIEPFHGDKTLEWVILYIQSNQTMFSLYFYYKQEDNFFFFHLIQQEDHCYFIHMSKEKYVLFIILFWWIRTECTSLLCSYETICYKFN